MLEKFLPSRQKHKSSSSQSSLMVADLDALLTEKVSFKLLGRVHTINPLTVEQFIRFAASYGKFMTLQDKEVVTPEELIEHYHEMISSVCDSITKEDIGKMNQQQSAALFQIMVDLHTGRLFADEKKTLRKVQSLLGVSQGQS